MHARLSITTTCPGRSVGARTCSTSVSKTSRVVVPSTAREGPIPFRLMLESNVVFLPQLRGTEQRALSPLGPQAYKVESEVLVAISSTNTSGSASTFSATIDRQAALKYSSRSVAPTVLFRLKHKRLKTRRTVELLMPVSVMYSRKRRLWATVAAGRHLTSSSRSFLAFLSLFGGRPGLFFGVRESLPRE